VSPFLLVCPEHADDVTTAQHSGLRDQRGQGEHQDGDGGQGEGEHVGLELNRGAGAGEGGQVDRRADHVGQHHGAHGAGHDRGEHGRHGFGHHEPGGAFVSHDGQPGQGQLALRRSKRQPEDHDEQAERGGGGDGERDDQPGAVLQR
jgi:hypothetical protein